MDTTTQNKKAAKVTLQTVRSGSYKSSDGQFEVILNKIGKSILWDIYPTGAAQPIHHTKTWMEARDYVIAEHAAFIERIASQIEATAETEPAPAETEMVDQIEKTAEEPATKKTRRSRRQKATA